MLRWWFLFSLAIAVCFSGSAGASSYLEVDDDVYALLSRLEAEGVVNSALLSTRPISRAESARLLHEAEVNAHDRSAFIKDLVGELKQRIGPEVSGLKLLDSVYATYINTNADVRTLTYGITREKEQALNYNNDGDLYARGSNERVGMTLRLENVKGFSFFLNPEFRAGQSDSSELIMKRGYIVFDFGWDLIVGRDSQWWGPGRHGAILLTNNAEPFTFVKVANPNPVILPWVFKYLGPFGFTFFATQLEQDRADVSAPYLWGMRMDFKPHPMLEIGIQRTALLGGEGRPTNADIWWNSITGMWEHCTDPNGCSEEPGDQRAGYDLKLTLPFSMQPVQVYMEADGEDSSDQVLPRYWAYLYGLYLPRVLSFERLEFRFEWAQTFDNNSVRPTSWYLNNIYTAGYTYNGLIIGHHMGTDSDDLFMELTCRVPEKNARVSLSYDRMRHNLSFDVNETVQELLVRTVLNVTGNTDIDLTYGYAWIHNAGNVPGVEQGAYTAAGMVTKRF